MEELLICIREVTSWIPDQLPTVEKLGLWLRWLGLASDEGEVDSSSLSSHTTKKQLSITMALRLGIAPYNERLLKRQFYDL